MLWLALHLPHLPLQVYARGEREPQRDSQPLAITSGTEAGAVVVAANHTAQALGIQAGMRVSAACALASELRLLARDPAREQALLERLAAWALQFTSLVSLAGPDTVLVEIEGSQKLFGGLNKIHQRIARGIAELGFSAHLACAPTPLAAQWFARSGLALRVQHRDALRHALEKLPIDVLCEDATTRDLLHRFGARTLGDCLRLPRDGLARRAGVQLLEQIDRALGLRPDPRLPFVAPQTWSAALPLPAPVENAEALLFAVRRLLAELCGWLTATGHGVDHPRFEFIHEKQTATLVTLELAGASRDLDHLTTLLRERLARTELPRAVVEIAVTSGRVVPLASRNLAFLPDSSGQRENTKRFMERLSARLGSNTILGLVPWPDYRPECAWRACEPGRDTESAMPHAPARPLWLLTTPRPLRDVNATPHDHEGGPLSLLSGPERIEAGWWDGQYAARDYFIARDAMQSLLWVYRERHAGGGWFVHGMFA